MFRRERKCVHHYLYLIDHEFGFMHVRIQGWIPYECQIYVNGREWLARQLDAPASATSVTTIRCCSRRPRDGRQAVRPLRPPCMAEGVQCLRATAEPVAGQITAAGFGGYYWVLDQAEIATDVMFKTRPALLKVWPDIVHHASVNMSAEDVLGFLGRKLHPSLQAQVVTDTKRRPQGWRVRHRMGGNWVKVYDKVSVLRVETTINNPRKAHRFGRRCARSRLKLTGS